MLSLLIASEVRLFREGLTALLARRESIHVLGTATECDEAVRLARDLRPDVTVVDQSLPHSLALTRALVDAGPRIRVVVLGIPDAEELLLAFAEAGVAGYVPRDGSLQDFVRAVEGAVRGELHCSPQLAGTIARRLAWRAAATPEMPRAVLTAREAEVVTLVAKGRSNKEIAGALGIEVATVKNHVHNLLEKLNVRRRAEVAARFGGRGAALTGPGGAPTHAGLPR
jgi:two-component system, NarL family, nitrate/nitrite response regulator NarL